MAIYIERSDAGLNLQLKTCAAKIGTYSAALGLTAADVTSLKADSLALDYLLTCQASWQSFAQNFTAFKTSLRKGGDQVLGALPVAPVLPVAPPMPAIDIEARFRALLQRMTHSSNYTTAIGEDLGIEAPVETKNLAIGKPVFSIHPTSGGYPELMWTKGKYQGVEIWKDSGTGFVKLERDMRPGYIDKSPLPAAGASAIWRYKMIYISNDEIIGNWSDVVSITVHGEI